MGFWLFGRRSTALEVGLFRGFTDWHSHILPGVDDGVRTMEDSLAILDMYGKAGAAVVWLTPHVMEDVPNTTESLKERFTELKASYNGPVRLCLAAEYMMDNLFLERLSAGDVMPIGERGDHLLVETSCYNAPYALDDTLGLIRSRGYFPVLAHPERYRYMDIQQYRRLKAAGTRFQLNLTSLAGLYGTDIRKKAEALLRQGFYDYAGCDIHRMYTLGKLFESRFGASDIQQIEKLKIQ